MLVELGTVTEETKGSPMPNFSENAQHTQPGDEFPN